MYKRVNDDIFYEVNGNIILIYFKKTENQFVKSNKCSATHVLEQVFDEDDQLISEELKELI